MNTPEAKKKERSFALSLPAFVRGGEAGDPAFAEQAEVAAMSAEEATLKLRSRVRIGMKLHFAIHVPRTFFLESPLEMALSGTVVQIQPPLFRAGDDPLVRLRLDRSYAILAH
ncbi:MAG: hypothetical protein FJY82_06050 [Candidatus Aminicenantes bacterium]|nr:hypothetical protein [Candidatus Aminicenantes bacterium]